MAKKKAAKKTVAKKKAATKKAAKKAAKKTVKKTVAAKPGKATTKTAKKSTKAVAGKTTKKPAAAKKIARNAAAHPMLGRIAPDFELMDGDGKGHRLSDYQGRRVVLYFYPKDNTPGCTTEACGFRDAASEFTKRNAVVLGVSPDSIESHYRFATKFSLPFPLLADPEHAVAEQFGAWGEKNRYGKTTEGVLRTTFIIDEDGRVQHVFSNVKTDGHEKAVLARLDAE